MTDEEVEDLAIYLARCLVVPLWEYWHHEIALRVAPHRKRMPAQLRDAINRSDCEALSAFIKRYCPEWESLKDELLLDMFMSLRNRFAYEDECALRGASHRIKEGKKNQDAIKEALKQIKQTKRTRKGQAVKDVAGALSLDESTIRRHLRQLHISQR